MPGLSYEGKQMNKYQNPNNGFSLVEVMVALVVVAVGLLALGKLHSQFFRSAADASQRTEAVAIAQQIEEDLRSYSTLEPDEAGLEADKQWATAAQDKLAYSFIDDNQGGSLFQGLVPNEDGYFSIDNKEVKWEVEQVNNVKNLSIFVLYTDEKGQDTELDIRTAIAAYDPNRLELLDDSGAAIGGGYVRNTQQTLLIGTAPDVIPVGIGEYDVDGDGVNDGVSRQTSKPTPDVSKKGGSVKATFEVVSYLDSTVDSITGTADAFVFEKYTTINCQCDKASGSTTTYTPSRVTWFQNEDALLGGLLGGRTGITKDKQYGISFPGTGSSIYQAQDATCTTCCRDHHDVTLSSDPEFYPEQSDADLDGNPDPVPGCNGATKEGCFDPDRIEDSDYASGNHLHFFDNDSVPDDPYIEACRVLEIGGQERVMQDWRLVKLDLIPDAYFESDANIAAYSGYVEDVVKAFVDGNALPEMPSIAPELTSIPAGSTLPLSARAIYVDYMASLSSPIDGYEAAINSSTPLYKIPFYTINVTKLAGWKSQITSSGDWSSPWLLSPDYTLGHNATKAQCSNSPSANPCVEDEQIEDELLVDDPTYVRGILYSNNATAGSQITVGTILYKGNEGLIDRSPVDSNARDFSNYIESTLEFTIN